MFKQIIRNIGRNKWNDITYNKEERVEREKIKELVDGERKGIGVKREKRRIKKLRKRKSHNFEHKRKEKKHRYDLKNKMKIVKGEKWEKRLKRAKKPCSKENIFSLIGFPDLYLLLTYSESVP